MFVECIVYKGSADEPDFLNYKDSAVEVSKVFRGEGMIFIKNVDYASFKEYIDGNVYTWSMVNYIDWANHYELWLEV